MLFKSTSELRLRSVNSKIFAAIITVGTFSIIVKLFSTFQHLVMAYRFGTSDALDAFLIAFSIPSLAINIVTGSLNAAFMPTYIQVLDHDGKESAFQLFSNMTIVSSLLVLFLITILVFIIPHVLPILCPGFNDEKIKLTRSLFFLLLPIVLFSGLSSIYVSVLNARERFVLGALAPVAIPAVTLLFLIILAPRLGIFALVYGVIAGFVMETILLILGLMRRKYPLRWHWYGFNSNLRQVLKQLLPMAGGALLMSSTDIIDKMMAAMLSPGSVSSLSYGNKIVGFFLGTGAFAIGTAVFPHFSKMISMNQWDNVRNTLKTYGYLICMISIPLTAAIFFYSTPIVAFLFERGAFETVNTQVVGRVQSYYVLQIPFYFLGILGVKLISAFKKNHFLLVISGINLILNVVGNLVFMRYLGVAGISLSTSVVYAIAMAMIYLSVIKQLKIHEKTIH